MRIKCIGNRSVEVQSIKGKITLIIYWKDDKRLAGLEFDKEEALKLVGELNGLIRFDPSKK